ncbi:MAG: nickel-responsive transcriptional regulator NikR [Armatimonadetes bacterium]|nr:nickel-responsive transcriptional regulator NikR [Armatimonadota bacterium]
MGVERFGVSMEEELLRAFDELITRKGYRNRSEAIRDLIRDFLVRDRWQEQDAPVVGAITLVYDHQARLLEETMTDLQHEYQDNIHCSTHVHLDEHHCVEVIVVSGPVLRVRQLADRLLALRGVKHGQLACTAIAWPSQEGQADHEHGSHSA